MKGRVLRPRSINVSWPVRLTLGKKSVVVREATLDTGATSTVIGKDVAQKLGLGPFLVRTRSARQVRGRLTEFRGFVDKIELLDRENPRRAQCSITGPVNVYVTSFGSRGQMLLGADVMGLMRMRIALNPGAFQVRCETISDLLDAAVLGRAFGLW